MPYQDMRLKARFDAANNKTAAAPASGAPSAPAAPMPPTAPISTATPTAGGAKIVDPGKDSMAGLKSAAEGMGGGGGSDIGDTVNLAGPSKVRQGIGSRIPPQYSASLAALRQVY